MKSHNPPANLICRAAQLARFDVILTTYTTLAADLSHTDNLKARRGGKYRYLASPLRQVVFWRLCMDESQMLGSGAGRAAQMLSQVPANNRSDYPSLEFISFHFTK